MAQNDDNKEPEMPNNYMPSLSTGFYGSYILLPLNDNERESEPGEQKISAEQQSFLDTSAQKKQHYNQYESISNIDVNRMDDSVLVDDPHFVLTLNNLSDFNVDNNKSEAETLKELQNCIENKIQNPIIDAMRDKLAAVYQVVAARVVITDIYFGTTNIGYIIIDCKKDGVVEIVKNAAQFEAKIKAGFKSYKDVKITPPPKSIKTLPPYTVVKSYHVSCASDGPRGSCESDKPCANWGCSKPGCRLAGVVLYMKDGKTRWNCNGRSCRTGYIIIKQTGNGGLDKVPASCGAIHGKVYKSVFNEDPKGIVGSGLSRSGGVWKWGSYSFNEGSTNGGCGPGTYHKSGYTMNDIESKWIERAIKNWWETGNPNTTVDESLVIFKD